MFWIDFGNGSQHGKGGGLQRSSSIDTRRYTHDFLSVIPKSHARAHLHPCRGFSPRTSLSFEEGSLQACAKKEREVQSVGYNERGALKKTLSLTGGMYNDENDRDLVTSCIKW